MAMFPDSGVPPGDAKNSLPDVATLGCDELWYSTSRCQPRFDPAAANAMLAEDMNLIMRGGVTYQCDRLDNIERAVRYIVQRGLARAAYLTGGPQAYVTNLDPTATHYNNFMTLTITTAMTNITNNVTVNVDGLGPVQILRNDMRPLEAGDLLMGRPYIIAYMNGYFYMCGLASSQVPLVVKGAIDAWIRTDGNDITGDGTANTPEKAFKTIAGCWQAVGSRYAASPLFTINMRFGIPGTYAGTSIGPFGGAVRITGDINNHTAYKISCAYMTPDGWSALWVASIASIRLEGVTFMMDHPPPEAVAVLRCLGGTQAIGHRIAFDVVVSNPRAVLIDIWQGSFAGNTQAGSPVNEIRVNGNNHTIGYFMVNSSGAFVGSWHNPGEVCNYYFQNINVTGSVFQWATGLGTQHWHGATVYNSNVIGPMYRADENSVINMAGQPVPGSTAGVVATGGQFIA